MSVVEWTDNAYDIDIWRILCSSYKKLVWVGFKLMTTELFVFFISFLKLLMSLLKKPSFTSNSWRLCFLYAFKKLVPSCYFIVIFFRVFVLFVGWTASDGTLSTILSVFKFCYWFWYIKLLFHCLYMLVTMSITSFPLFENV